MPQLRKPSRLRAQLAYIGGHRLFVWLVILGAVAATLPSVQTGWSADDWFMRLYAAPSAQIEGLSPRPWRLFTFADGDPAHNQALMNAGIFPWWAHPEVKLSFFRPISVLFHRLDTMLWPDRADLMHLHSLVWFGIALYFVAQFYQRWIGKTHPFGSMAVAGLALWCFALDDARGPTVGWISNRNALISLALGAWALCLHRRAYQLDARPKDAAFAPAVWLLSLLAGETGICALGFFAGHSLFLQPGPLVRRAFTLTPYLLVFVGYLALRDALGFGVYGSAFYVDPLRDPEHFSLLALERIPQLLGAALGGFWSDIPAGISIAFPGTAPLCSLVCGLFAALVIYVGWPFWRQDPAAKALATGTAGTMVILSSTFPADRVLSFASVGLSGLIAMLIARATQRGHRFRWRRRFAWWLALLHVVVAPGFLPTRSGSMEFVNRPIMRVDQSLPGDLAMAEKTLVMVNPPSDAQAAYMAAFRASQGRQVAKRIRWLSSGGTAVSVERLDAYSLRLVQEGGFLPRLPERMLRASSHPFVVGEQINTDEMTVTVESLTPDKRPAAVRIRFDRPLEDAHYVWARWEHDRFVPYTPPQIGAPDHLASTDILASFAPLPDPHKAPPTLAAWQNSGNQLAR